MADANNLTKRLTEITLLLLDSSRPAYSLRNEVMELRSVFEAAGASTFHQTSLGDGETLTTSGVAISPAMAAMCLDDFARTVQFIRGINDALLTARQGATARPVNVLYAGCGPWATLAIPLMMRFPSDEAVFSLLDIHRESIESARRMIKALGLDDRVASYVVADASEFRVATEPDVIVVEMLRAALASEPQVDVSRSLVRQAPKASLVPAEIALDLVFADSSHEFIPENAAADIAMGRDRIEAGRILTIDRAALLQPASTELPTVRLTVPEYDPSKYRPTICTTISVHGEHVLKDYDSGVTLPRTLKSDREPKPGDILEFSYVISGQPGLRVRNVGRVNATCE